MKTIISIIVFTLFMILSLSAQDYSNVPQNIQESFKAHYPHITFTHWEANENLQYEAHFMKAEMPIVATFDLSGKWMGESKFIPVADLPPHIEEMLLLEYGTYALVQAEEVKSSLNMSFYKIGLDIADAQWDILIEENGEIVMEEKVHERKHPWIRNTIAVNQ